MERGCCTEEVKGCRKDLGTAATFRGDRGALAPPAWLAHQHRLAGEGTKACAAFNSHSRGKKHHYSLSSSTPKPGRKPDGNRELAVKAAQCRGHTKSLNLALSLELASSYSSLTPQSLPAPPPKSISTTFLSLTQPHHTRSHHTLSWTSSCCNSKCQQRSRKAHAVCQPHLNVQAHSPESCSAPAPARSQHATAATGSLPAHCSLLPREQHHAQLKLHATTHRGHITSSRRAARDRN